MLCVGVWRFQVPCLKRRFDSGRISTEQHYPDVSFCLRDRIDNHCCTIVEDCFHDGMVHNGMQTHSDLFIAAANDRKKRTKASLTTLRSSIDAHSARRGASRA